MAQVTTNAPGVFCWFELGTTDQAAARTFYTTLFGWSVREMPMGESGTYSMLEKGEKDAAGLYQISPEMRAQGIPSHWMNYVAVESVDHAVAKARTLGGKVMMEPMDVMDVGRMAVAQDPTGATFALWQAKKHIGAGVTNEVGAATWTELVTGDTKAAEAFYTGLFGWQAKPQPMETMVYTVFRRGETQAAGMMPKPKEMGGGAPELAHVLRCRGLREDGAARERARRPGAGADDDAAAGGVVRGADGSAGRCFRPAPAGPLVVARRRAQPAGSTARVPCHAPGVTPESASRRRRGSRARDPLLE